MKTSPDPVKKALREKQRKSVRRLLVQTLESKFHNNQTEASEALGVSQAYISCVKSRRAFGLGLDFLEALATANRKLIDRVLDRELVDLDVALDFAGELYGERTVSEAIDEHYRSGRRKPAEWMKFLRERHAIREEELDSVVRLPAPPATPKVRDSRPPSTRQAAGDSSGPRTGVRTTGGRRPRVVKSG